MSSQRPGGSARGGGPRGPLPAAVYWRRRVFVLGLAFALVFVIARWLGGASDGSSDDAPVAEQAGTRLEATETVTAGESTDAATDAATDATAKGRKARLAVPEGRCDPADIAITPSVAKGAEAGRDVTVRLSLQTLTSEACTWRFSRASVVVRIRQDGDPVWSSQQCPRAVPTESVVVRRAVATVVKLTWAEARRSRATCTRGADWALPGDYTVAASSLGGEPTEADFRLARPARETVEVTVPPEQDEKAERREKPTKPVN